MSEHIRVEFPWRNATRQREAALFGMWVFLASEILLFAGLFAGYTVYRNLYPDAFFAAAPHTNLVFGAANTALLMTSSLTMAIASRASEAGKEHLARRLMFATLAFGLAFLVVKGFEYREDIHQHLLPWPAVVPETPGAGLFWTYYWLTTGVHAVHVTIGLCAISYLIASSGKRARWLSEHSAQECVALYWHLVDMIWVVLFALLYLPGRGHG